MGVFETQLEETFHKVVDVLEKKRLRFFLIGAVALGHRIVPRATQDIDLIVDPEPFGSDDLFVRMLRARFTLNTEKYTRAELRRFFKKGMFIRFYKGVHWVDIAVVTTDHDRKAFANATALNVFGRDALVAMVEDLLVYKLRRDEPKDAADRHLIMARWLSYLDVQYIEGAMKIIHDARARRLWKELKAAYRAKRPLHGE